MRRRPRRPKRDWPARQGAASAPHHTALLQGLFQQCANPPKISYRDPAGCLRASYSHPAAAIPLLCPVLYHCRGSLLLFVSPAPAFLLLSCAPYTRTPEKPSVLVACCLGRYRHCFPFWNRSFAAPRFPSFSPLYPAATRLLFFLRPRLRRIAPSIAVTRTLHHRRPLEQASLLSALLHCKPSRVLAAHRVPRRRSCVFRTHAADAEGKLARLIPRSVISCSFSDVRSCLPAFLSSAGAGICSLDADRATSFLDHCCVPRRSHHWLRLLHLPGAIRFLGILGHCPRTLSSS